jgi:hypothetical protein
MFHASPNSITIRLFSTLMYGAAASQVGKSTIGVDILTNFHENWSNGSKVEVDKHTYIHRQHGNLINLLFSSQKENRIKNLRTSSPLPEQVLS